MKPMSDAMKKVVAKGVKRLQQLVDENGGDVDEVLLLKFFSYHFEAMGEHTQDFTQMSKCMSVAIDYARWANQVASAARQEEPVPTKPSVETALYNPLTGETIPVDLNSSDSLMSAIRRVANIDDEFGATRGCQCDRCQGIREQSKTKVNGVG